MFTKILQKKVEKALSKQQKRITKPQFLLFLVTSFPHLFFLFSL